MAKMGDGRCSMSFWIGFAAADCAMVQLQRSWDASLDGADCNNWNSTGVLLQVHVYRPWQVLTAAGGT